MPALTEVRALVEQRGWRIGFPVEIRHAPADDVWLSTAHERDSVYLAFHVNARTDHTRVLRRASSGCCGPTTAGRTGASCTPAPPRTWRRRTRASRTSSAVRDRVDPDRLFTNAYLDRVLTR